jgi:hypothetical protein
MCICLYVHSVMCLCVYVCTYIVLCTYVYMSVCIICMCVVLVLPGEKGFRILLGRRISRLNISFGIDTFFCRTAVNYVAHITKGKMSLKSFSVFKG